MQRKYALNFRNVTDLRAAGRAYSNRSMMSLTMRGDEVKAFAELSERRGGRDRDAEERIGAAGFYAEPVGVADDDAGGSEPGLDGSAVP